MTIKEIKDLRVQQEEIKQDIYKTYDRIHKESQQALKQLDELEQKAHDDLIKKIAKHFKGIKPYIILSNTELVIGFNDVSNFAYRYGQFSWNNITSKLAHTIKAEYEEVYGEPQEIKTSTINLGDGIKLTTSSAQYNPFFYESEAPYTFSHNELLSTSFDSFTGLTKYEFIKGK